MQEGLGKLFVKSALITKAHNYSSRLLKNTHLLRCAHPSLLRRTVTYASFLTISRALHPDVFDQPGENYFFKNLIAILCQQGPCVVLRPSYS